VKTIKGRGINADKVSLPIPLCRELNLMRRGIYVSIHH